MFSVDVTATSSTVATTEYILIYELKKWREEARGVAASRWSSNSNPHTSGRTNEESAEEMNTLSLSDTIKQNDYDNVAFVTNAYITSQVYRRPELSSLVVSKFQTAFRHHTTELVLSQHGQQQLERHRLLFQTRADIVTVDDTASNVENEAYLANNLQNLFLGTGTGRIRHNHTNPLHPNDNTTASHSISETETAANAYLRVLKTRLPAGNPFRQTTSVAFALLANGSSTEMSHIQNMGIPMWIVLVALYVVNTSTILGMASLARRLACHQEGVVCRHRESPCAAHKLSLSKTRRKPLDLAALYSARRMQSMGLKPSASNYFQQQSLGTPHATSTIGACDAGRQPATAKCDVSPLSEKHDSHINDVPTTSQSCTVLEDRAVEVVMRCCGVVDDVVAEMTAGGGGCTHPAAPVSAMTCSTP